MLYPNVVGHMTFAFAVYRQYLFIMLYQLALGDWSLVWRRQGNGKNCFSAEVRKQIISIYLPKAAQRAARPSRILGQGYSPTTLKYFCNIFFAFLQHVQSTLRLNRTPLVQKCHVTNTGPQPASFGVKTVTSLTQGPNRPLWLKMRH